jgi:hypothetical protein
MDATSLRPVLSRLAELAGSEDGRQMMHLLQTMGMSQKPETRFSPVAACDPQDQSSVGIWQAVPGEAGRFVRRDDRRADWRMWADAPEIVLGEGRRRVVLLGESVARGYFYAPAVTPAAILQGMLRTCDGLADLDVIDLSRTSILLPEMVHLLRQSAQLRPDAVVVFAGNNWFWTRLWSREAYVEMATVLRRRGAVACRAETLARIELDTVAAFRTAVAEFADRHAIPVVLVIPEFNLRDWTSETLPLLPEAAMAEWLQCRDVARSTEDAEARQAAVARMLALDGGSSDVSAGLAADAALEAGDVASARRFLQMKRDAPLGRFVWSSARCSTGLQAALRRTAGDLGLACVDLPELLAEAAADGIPGFEWFLDYCHLSSKGMVLAMAHTAHAVARELKVAAPDPESLRVAAPEPAAEVEATASVLAAVHGSHLRQPDASLRTLLQRAAACSPDTAARLLGDYLDGHMRTCPTSLTGSFARLSTNAQARCYFGSAGQVASMKLAKFSFASIARSVLEERGGSLEGADEAAAATHDVGLEPLDLLHPGRSRDHVVDEWHEQACAYDIRFDPTSRHAFYVAEPIDLEFRIVLRLPSVGVSAASVALSLNGGAPLFLEMTPRWRVHRWNVTASETRSGLNAIEIAWPDLPVDYASECELRAVALERMSPRRGGTARGHLAGFTVRRARRPA